MNSVTEEVHQPIRTINLAFTSLTLILVIFISVFSWQSWHKEKADLIPLISLFDFLKILFSAT